MASASWRSNGEAYNFRGAVQKGTNSDIFAVGKNINKFSLFGMANGCASGQLDIPAEHLTRRMVSLVLAFRGELVGDS